MAHWPNKREDVQGYKIFTQDTMFMGSCLSVFRHIRETKPFLSMQSLLFAIANNDIQAAADEYHALTHALLCEKAHHVAGDVWKDFLLKYILEVDNPLASQAAAQVWNEPLCFAAAQDLRILFRLFSLNSRTVKKWISDCYEAALSAQSPQKTQHGDNISTMAGSAWWGQNMPPLPSAKPEPDSKRGYLPAQLYLESWPDWDYPTLEWEVHVPLQSLHEMRVRFFKEEDWGTLVEELWHFHSLYGSGEFLCSDGFAFSKGRLIPRQYVQPGPTMDDLVDMDDTKNQILTNLSRFLNGQPYEHMLIYGPAGTGKTALMEAVRGDVEGLCVIQCDYDSFVKETEAMRRILDQPLRYILWLDGPVMFPERYMALEQAYNNALGHSKECMLCLSAREGAPDSALFGLQIQTSLMDTEGFFTLASEIIRRRGRQIRKDTLQNLCLDWELRTADLSARGACRLADSLESE